MANTELEAIIKQLFTAFDRLDDDSYFLPYLSEQYHFSFHGEIFDGIDGFKEWMAGNRATYEPGSLYHHPYGFEYTEMADNMYQVDFMLDFKARSLKGETFENTVKERWVVDSSDNQFKIISYIVEPTA